MSFIRMDKGLPRKPKFRRLARELGLEDHALAGYLYFIWSAVDEVGQDFEGTDEDIACAVCAPSALVCALCAVGWATRFEGGITFNTNDPAAEARTLAHRARAARSYERRKSILRAESAPVCASALLPPSLPPSLTSLEEKNTSCSSVPTNAAKRRVSKPKDELSWTAEGGWRGITDLDRAMWSKAFPAVDIDAQLARATVWLLANPKRVKTKWRSWLTGVWFSRAQDRGGVPVDSGPRMVNTTNRDFAAEAARQLEMLGGRDA